MTFLPLFREHQASPVQAVNGAGRHRSRLPDHAQRKFFDLHAAHKSPVAQRALEQIAQVYEIEREFKACSADERQRVRLERSRPNRCAARVLAADPVDDNGWHRHRQSLGLQPAALAGADSVRE